MTKWTEQQERAITSRHRNLLVSAAAGSGKTTVMIERIVSLLKDEEHPASLDRLLVVTFTNPAAASMKEKLAERLAPIAPLFLASLALTALAKATAWIQGRDYVLPRDVRFVFHDCIEHRLIWSQEAATPAAKTAVLNEILQSVKAPAIK